MVGRLPTRSTRGNHPSIKPWAIKGSVGFNAKTKAGQWIGLKHGKDQNYSFDEKELNPVIARKYGPHIALSLNTGTNKTRKAYLPMMYWEPQDPQSQSDTLSKRAVWLVQGVDIFNKPGLCVRRVRKSVPLRVTSSGNYTEQAWVYEVATVQNNHLQRIPEPTNDFYKERYRNNFSAPGIYHRIHAGGKQELVAQANDVNRAAFVLTLIDIEELTKFCTPISEDAKRSVTPQAVSGWIPLVPKNLKYGSENEVLPPKPEKYVSEFYTKLEGNFEQTYRDWGEESGNWKVLIAMVQRQRMKS